MSRDISTQQLLLHMGELTREEIRVAKAAYGLGYQAATEAALQQQGEAVAWQYELIGKSGEIANSAVSGARYNMDAGISPFGRAGIDYHEDAAVRETPLYTHPPKPVVSNEMVARAIAAYIAHRGLCENEVPPERDEMRAALEAALGVKS